MLSARLDRYYGHLRRPPGCLPLPSSSLVIGRTAPTKPRSLPGRGGPLQFPPPLSERSAPSTPGSPSRLRFQDLRRFHGLRPSAPGSAPPRPTHTGRRVTTRQASLHVTDRSVAHPHPGRSTLGFDPARFQTTPPACYRAPWRLPGPDSHRQATTSLRISHQSFTRSTTNSLDALQVHVSHNAG
jgi:hypothetical protein